MMFDLRNALKKNPKEGIIKLQKQGSFPDPHTLQKGRKKYNGN